METPLPRREMREGSLEDVGRSGAEVAVTSQTAIPAGASITITDLLDHCAKIQPGQEVLRPKPSSGARRAMVDKVARVLPRPRARGLRAAPPCRPEAFFWDETSPTGGRPAGIATGESEAAMLR